MATFAIPKGTKPAEIAQLVEHDLAKVGVASSSLVFRSKPSKKFGGFFFVQKHSKQHSNSRPQPLRGSWSEAEAGVRQKSQRANP